MLDAPTCALAAASFAHEMKNPLTAVKALVQLLAESATDSRTRNRLDVVHAEVLRMEAILRTHLAPPALARVDTDLGALVDDVAALLGGRAMAAGVTIVRDPDTAVIRGDAARLRSALHNLVGNAVEATQPGGRVHVAIRGEDDRVLIEVRDTGQGIPADDLARLGTPFFTRREGGTGLGVMLARMAIVEHGGTLEYRSELGQGTVARVMLPVVSA